MADSMQLKGSLFTLTVLQLNSADIRKLNAELLAKIQLAPNFFNHAPVVIDISELKDDAKSLDFNELKAILLKNNLVPVGIKGASKDVQAIAIDAGFACIGESSTPSGIKPDEKKAKAAQPKSDNQKHAAAEVPNPGARGFKLITQPIRSGQQVYASGDLVVVAPVSPGAELLAEGNIHIYDRLRGRALAGINGDTSARVFCKQLEAELVSIAGEYQVFEHTEYPHMSKPTQVYLQDGKLIAEPL